MNDRNQFNLFNQVQVEFVMSQKCLSGLRCQIGTTTAIRRAQLSERLASLGPIQYTPSNLSNITEHYRIEGFKGASIWHTHYTEKHQPLDKLLNVSSLGVINRRCHRHTSLNMAGTALQTWCAYIVKTSSPQNVQ